MIIVVGGTLAHLQTLQALALIQIVPIFALLASVLEGVVVKTFVYLRDYLANLRGLQIVSLPAIDTVLLIREVVDAILDVDVIEFVAVSLVIQGNVVSIALPAKYSVIVVGTIGYVLRLALIHEIVMVDRIPIEGVDEFRLVGIGQISLELQSNPIVLVELVASFA